MTVEAVFRAALADCPMVAILRGITPGEADAVGDALFAEGFRIIEVPLNSPDPLRSIERLSARFGDAAIVGAGTVLTVEDVGRIKDAGGRIIVSPSTDVDVIAAAVAAGLISSPGYYTPSEAFAAVKAGAHALKLFPAEAAPPAVVKAHKAVLPPELPLLIVGGVTASNMAAYLDAGANGFGLGSGLYRPGRAAAEVASRAREYVSALTQANRG